ncbi:MAG: hypothetical protein Q9177_005402 [Variospora cf. flavescens]
MKALRWSRLHNQPQSLIAANPTQDRNCTRKIDSEASVLNPWSRVRAQGLVKSRRETTKIIIVDMSQVQPSEEPMHIVEVESSGIQWAEESSLFASAEGTAAERHFMLFDNCT